MTPEITQEAISALSAEQFNKVKGWVLDDETRRTEKHKQETLAKIRELARSIEVGIKLKRPGVRAGRPKRIR